MKRRDFLKKAGVAVAASAAFSPAVFSQGGKMRMEMITSWPTGLPTIFGGATNFAKYVGEMTGGDIEIEVFPAGAQVGGLEVYDNVSNGAFTFGHTAPYYYLGKDPAHAFFTSVPFGLNVGQHNAWIHSGNGQALWDELNAQDNMIAFAAGNTGVQMGGWFRKEINTVDDLKGLSMRIPGLGAKAMGRVGVNVQVLPGGEIYQALETGAIDAAEFVGPFDDQKLGFNRVADYYYTPGWHETGASLCTYINLDEWNDWPEDVQAIMKAAAAQSNQQMTADYDAFNSIALKELSEQGIEVRNFPNEVLAAIEAEMDAIHEESVEASENYAKIYADWTTFRDDVRAMHFIQEYAWHKYVYGD